jgi:hypothetical protein
MVQVRPEMAIRVRWLPLFLVLAGLASPRLEPFLAPLAPPLDFALSFRRHRHLSIQRSVKPGHFCLKSRHFRVKTRALLLEKPALSFEDPALPLEDAKLSDYKRP